MVRSSPMPATHPAPRTVAELEAELARVRKLAAGGIVERACDQCGKLGQSTPAQSGIPIGWAKLFAQISTWVTKAEDLLEGEHPKYLPLLRKAAVERVLCSDCWPSVVQAIAPTPAPATKDKE